MAEKETKHKLTAKEKARAEKIEEITKELLSDGYRREDVTISIVRANVMATVFGLPLILVFGAAFYLRNDLPYEFNPVAAMVFFLLMIVLIVVHELLHGLVWGLFAPRKFKAVELGFIKELLTPYCACTDPLSKGAYILGSFMPCLVLGILPALAGVLTGSFYLLLMGLMMILGAGGDLAVIVKMLTYRSKGRELLIMDHPTECGFIAYTR